MKKKVKSKLILLLAGVASLLLLGGCTFREKTIDEALANRGLSPQVTYYANGGTLNSKRDTLDIYYKAGSPAYNIGVDKSNSGTVTVERNQYLFGGWYFAQSIGSDGKPTYADAEKTSYALGEAVDFSVRLKEGDHWHLIAKWETEINVQVVLSVDSGKVKGAEKEYADGDVLETRVYDTAGLVVYKSTPLALAADETHQFVEYYYDKECQQPVPATAWPMKKAEHTDNVTVYAKYIDKSWTVLRSASDVNAMWENTAAGKKYWLANDIDMSAATAVEPLASFACTLEGNGFAIDNMRVIKTLSVRNGKTGLFGDIQAGAKMRNVEFKNVRAEYTLAQACYVYFVFSSIADEAQIEGVTLSGSMELTKARPTYTARNLDSAFTWCLYGGGSEEKDAQYAERGFTVTGTPSTFISYKN